VRIFLDANILFSAAKSAGAVRLFLSELTARSHQLVADGYVIGEARRNIEAKFPSALADLDQLLAGIETSEKVSGPLAPQFLPDLVEKDRPVVSAALQHHCDILLTGDKTHFGAFYKKTVGRLQIHSSASLAQLIDNRA